MQKSMIRSKYSFKGLWDVILISLGLLYGVISYTRRFGFGVETLSIFIMFIGFCLWWTHHLVHHFIFTSSSFTVVRYIMPLKTIKYADVIDIGTFKIKTRVGNIQFAGTDNKDEIIKKFNELINQGKINRDELENKIITDEMVWRKSMLPSLIVALPFFVTIVYFWPFHKMWFSPPVIGLIGGLLLFVIISIVQWIVKKRLINNKTG
ncbi:MAG: hypothetical protein CVU44_05985 [Chloroflexi bacterium HGW-Chloroflexi-6]|nr:MAG: hypothetical protein CVU44_05985 [Chloroflexi bacterium HGW-Chloroflexi-6]